MSFLSKTSAFRRLKWHQWLWFFEAYWRLVWVYFRLNKYSKQWLTAKLHHRPKQNELGNKHHQINAVDMFEAVRLASRCHLHQPACLPKSIVLMDMLRLRGYPARIVIGVSKADVGNKLLSHAWVEIDGQIIGEKGSLSEQFNALANFEHSES